MLGEGAVPKVGCPKLLVVAPGVAGPDGPLVALPKDAPLTLLPWDPNSPVDGKGCWLGPWFPGAPRLNIFPVKPPKPPPLDGRFAPPVLIFANGFDVDGPESNDEPKLKAEAPTPEPKANGDEPF